MPVQEIPNHLHHEVGGFAARQPADGGLKNVQNRLKKLTVCERFSKIIDVTEEGRRKLYSRVMRASEIRAAMSVEQVCALLMSDKRLSVNSTFNSTFLGPECSVCDLLANPEVWMNIQKNECHTSSLCSLVVDCNSIALLASTCNCPDKFSNLATTVFGRFNRGYGGIIILAVAE